MRLASVLAVAFAIVAVAHAGNPPDPVQTKVVATGPGPCGIAARAGRIWVGVYGAGMLLEIDDATGRVEARVNVGRWACRVAVGPAAIWVTRDRAGELVRISRRSGRVQRANVGTGTFDVLLANGSVWTTSYDHAAIVRSDAATLRLTRVYKDGPNPAGLTRCAGQIWVGHGRSATWLTRIDPATNAIHSVEVDTAAPTWPRCIGSDLWVTASDTLLKLDAATGRVVKRLRLGGTLAEAAAGPDGLVWVTDKERSLVHRVWGGGASLTDSFTAGPGAYSLVRVRDAMWITSFAGSDVRRFDPQH